MEKQQQNFRSQNPSPPPYESSISSFSPSSFSHDGEGPEHSLHPSPAPQKEISRKQSTKRTGDDQVLKKLFSSGGKLLVPASHLRNIVDFASDQILAYLLMSSSSSAATRVEDWRSNWGKDKFPNMANASVAVSFMAFVSLASSSLISGYTICTL